MNNIIFNKQFKQSNLDLMLIIMLIFSTLITINSTSWISAWMGMEVNMMAFIPMLMTKTNKSSNSMMSYFMIQASSSSILLFMIMMNKLEINSYKINLFNYFIQISLLMKLGAAPFHWWMPKIINLMNWKNCFILLTWQKLAPLYLVYLTKSSSLIYFSIIMSMMIGAILGLNQTSLKLLITYSSINHISWMLMSLLIDIKMFIFYFIIYMTTIFFICMMFNNLNIDFLNQLFKNNNINIFTKINVMLMFLSMGGIPPMVGFLPKFKILMIMMENELILESMIFIVFSLITLLYYMSPLISMLLIIKMNNKWNLLKFNTLKFTMIMLMMYLTMSMLMILPLMFMMN
uniref:NADH dehydrogenase subunit 2 n=1 Tax=Leptocimbex linealis TaxID=2609717 RepID=UPI002237E980|nr:NADH dehydrogenase subunit 2 [Leptocimbex linealis]UYK52105.1 NADH dehydrogenase subunit 2 [Leptocimbex linealis]